MRVSIFKTKYLSLLEPVYLFAKKKNVNLYLVGGIVRDILLGRKRSNLDFDFCLRKGAINFGGKLARQIKAGFVVLDKEHGACRLVKEQADKIYTLDFTDFRGKNLAEDLKHRDFTINTLAIELKELFKEQNLNLEDLISDLYGGLKDIKLKIIRIANKQAFDEDALRILRAFSLSSTFGFKIDKETLKLIKLKKDKLSGISTERIRDELFKILEKPDAFNYLLMLDKLKILKIIIPEIEIMRGVKQGPYHHLDVWEHTLETIRQLEGLLAELRGNKGIQDYLKEIISADRSRRALIKFGALLHDIGKPSAKRREDGKTKFHGHERIGLEITEKVAKRLRLSNDELDSLRKMVFWHLRPGYLADNIQVTPRAAFRYFRDAAQEGLSILLLSMADQRATRGPLTSKKSRIQHEKVVLGLIKEYFLRQKKKRAPRLITGDDLIKKFKLEPSPLIGKILSEVEELQAIGKLSSKKEALSVASRFIPLSRRPR